MTARLVALAVLFVGLVVGPFVGPAEARSVKDAPADVTRVVTLPPVGQPGEPMILGIVVEDADGKPVEGALVYAYHSDARGYYGPRGMSDPRIYGYARTDSSGRVTLKTIRPAPYPGAASPARILVEIDPGNGAPVFQDECWFAGDVFLKPELIESEGQRGRLSRIVPLTKLQGDWRARWIVQVPQKP